MTDSNLLNSEDLDSILEESLAAGGDVSQYSSQSHSYHVHDGAWRWTGAAENNDWADSSNWALTDSTGNVIPSDQITDGGGPAIPQSEQNADVNVGYVNNTSPLIVVSNAPYYNQLRSLSVWQNSTLKITAQYQNGSSNGYVFSTAGLENYGTIIVDTPAKIELGGINTQSGTLTIMNNNGNVVFDNDSINNGGTINLINASLGTISNPININGGTVNLQSNSSILTNLWGEAGTINVDPSSVNTVYINDKYSNNDGNVQNVVINGVSENTHFGILGTSSQPTSAIYSKNDDGSYKLTITLENGRSINYANINVADGYIPPTHASIIADGTTGWLIEDNNSTSVGSYTDTDVHKTLIGIATDATNAGGDTSQYTSQGVGYHAHDNVWRWTGSSSGGDWGSQSNWTLYDPNGHVIPTSQITTGGAPAIPQSEQNADVSLGGINSSTPMTVVSNAPYYNQIRSLSVWQNTTLKITAQYQSGSSNGYVFATAGMENYGTIIVDTSAKVELGGVNVQSGTLTIMNNNGNVVFDNDQVNNGGTINLINSSLGTTSNPIRISGGTVNLQKNSSLLADLWGEGATINVDGSTVNTLYVNDKYSNNDGNIQSAVINGVSENTRFGILGTSSQPTSAAYTKNDDGSYKLVITLTNGRTISYPTIYAADGYTPPAQATIVTDGTTGWLVEGTSDNACFLAGVLISTPDGSVAVEKIEVGQKILASVNGHLVEREVVWVGKSHKVANASKTEDEAGYPVRILKGALADNVPAQDMLITSEHCLVFAGNFIPVRMLVNNRTIFYDRTVTDYDYYHIETEKHSIIIADGVLTESYLDTGNRSTFVSDNNVVSIWSKTKAWATDAAAPLNVERSFVEPIFRSLAERANTLSNTHNASACEELITDHALHLVTASGATIMPIRRDENKVLSFILPAGVDEVRLVSRSGRPSEVIGPFVDDRRRLGVLVGAMTLISADNVLPVIDHLSTKQLNGWHTLETEGVRWTNGNALLPLGDKTANKFTMLTIQIVAAGPYLLQVLENRKIRKSA